MEEEGGSSGGSGGADESFDSFGGLELSLGLSCGGSKAKTGPLHRPSNPNPYTNMMKTFLDPNPNPSPSPSPSPNEDLFAGEAIGRGGGGGVDLKRFLDPNPSRDPELLAGGSLSATRNLASQLDLSLQDKSIQLELGSAHEGFALNPNPRVAAASAAWGQSGPPQGINFFEHGSASTSVDNTSSSSDTKRGAELPPLPDFQCKYQEPQKKRKHLLDDYHPQKQDKPQEERATAAVHGFRKPGSNGWGGGVHGLVEAPSVAIYDEGTSQDPSNERDQFKGAVTCPPGSNPDKEYEESTGMVSDDGKGGGDAELTWMRSSREAWRHKGEPGNNNDKGDGFVKKSLKAPERGQHSAFLMPSAAPSLARRDGERHSSESEASEKEGRPSGGGGPDGEASSRHIVSTSPLNNNNSNSNNNGGSSTHQITFPVVPMTYSMPLGMSFPARFPFPYLVQVAPPPSDAQELTGTTPVPMPMLPMPMPMSMPRPFNNSFPGQVSPMYSPTSWVPALRPSTVPSYANPTPSARLDSDPAAEERTNNRSLGGGNGHDGMSKPVLLPTSMDASSSQGRAPFFNGTVPEPTNFRKGGVGQEGSAFHGFAPPPSLPLNLSEDSTGRGEITKRPPSSSKRDMLLSTPLQRGGKVECSNDADTSSNPNPNPHLEEDTSRGVLGGGGGLPFEKGSTENIPHAGGLVQGLSHIRPGIVPGMKFGGTGSRPDLPWVSATGPGPDGKTICGVMYRLNHNQVRIVCACHGQHMSSTDFVQHAGGIDITPISDQNGVVATQFPHTSQAASALG